MDGRRLAALGGVIETFYARAAEGGPWDIDALRGYLGTDFCHVLYMNDQGIILQGVSSGISDAELHHYLTHWAGRDEIGPSLFARSPRNAVTNEMLMSRAEFEGSEVYEGFYEPGRVVHFAVGYLPVDRGLNCGVSVQNARESGPIRPETLQDIDVVIPHLRRAMQIARAVEATRRQADAVNGLLAHWGLGLIQCDRQGTILALQGEAESMLRKARGLVCSRGGRLRLADEGADRRFATLLLNPGDALMHSGTTLYLDDPRDGSGLELTVLPFEGNGVPDEQRLVLCRRAGQPGSIDRRYLRQRYKLTPAEADVMAHLLVGRTLVDIATTRGSRIETIRGYVKQLPAKAELLEPGAACLHRLAGYWTAPPGRAGTVAGGHGLRCAGAAWPDPGDAACPTPLLSQGHWTGPEKKTPHGAGFGGFTGSWWTSWNQYLVEVGSASVELHPVSRSIP